MQALLDEVLSLRRKMTDCRYRGFVASTKMRVQHVHSCTMGQASGCCIRLRVFFVRYM